MSKRKPDKEPLTICVGCFNHLFDEAGRDRDGELVKHFCKATVMPCLSVVTGEVSVTYPCPCHDRNDGHCGYWRVHESGCECDECNERYADVRFPKKGKKR